MSKEIEKTEKKTLATPEETTWAGDTYSPAVDIWETDNAIVLSADVPGATKDKIEIDLSDDTLTIQARVSLEGFEGLRPLYTEYNVGNYFRRFSLGETIDQEKITADLSDGVLVVSLPKKEKELPRKITVQ